MTYNVPWACINNPPAHGLFGSLIIYNFYCLLKQSKWNEINKIIFLLNFYLFKKKKSHFSAILDEWKRALSSPLTCLAGIFPSQIKRGPNSEYKQGIQMPSPIPHPALEWHKVRQFWFWGHSSGLAKAAGMEKRIWASLPGTTSVQKGGPQKQKCYLELGNISSKYHNVFVSHVEFCLLNSGLKLKKCSTKTPAFPLFLYKITCTTTNVPLIKSEFT